MLVGTVATSACGGRSHEEAARPHAAVRNGAGNGGGPEGSAGASQDTKAGMNGGGASGHGAEGADGGTGNASVAAGSAGTAGGVASSGGGNAESSAAAGASVGGNGVVAGNSPSAGTGGVVTGATSDGGAGDTAGNGQAGEPGCHSVFTGCDCSWPAPACSDETLGVYLGRQCPPTLEEARRVDDWVITRTPGDHRGGYYTECANGWRGWSFSGCGATYSFGFDASGHLALWFNDSKICGGLACDAGLPDTSACPTCEMPSEPESAGSACITSQMTNGPSPGCQVDANGNWAVPLPCHD